MARGLSAEGRIILTILLILSIRFLKTRIQSSFSIILVTPRLAVGLTPEHWYLSTIPTEAKRKRGNLPLMATCRQKNQMRA